MSPGPLGLVRRAGRRTEKTVKWLSGPLAAVNPLAMVAFSSLLRPDPLGYLVRVFSGLKPNELVEFRDRHKSIRIWLAHARRPA